MKLIHLMAMGAAMAGLGGVGAAQQRAGGGLRLPPPAPPPAIGGFNGGLQGFPVFVVEREVPVYVERETPPPPVAVPLPQKSGGGDEPPRKPYVIGASYASLPGSCMKLIEEGVSFYYCSGEWYRQVGDGRGTTYKAIQRKL